MAIKVRSSWRTASRAVGVGGCALRSQASEDAQYAQAYQTHPSRTPYGQWGGVGGRCGSGIGRGINSLHAYCTRVRVDITPTQPWPSTRSQTRVPPFVCRPGTSNASQGHAWRTSSAPVATSGSTGGGPTSRYAQALGRAQQCAWLVGAGWAGAGGRREKGEHAYMAGSRPLPAHPRVPISCA
jgi:hypothetical protein